MVNETQEPIQESLPNLEAPPTEGTANTGGAPPSTDEQAGPITSSEAPPVTEAASTPDSAPAPGLTAEAAPVSDDTSKPLPQPEAPTGPSREEIIQLQRQSAEYEQLRMKAGLQQESDKYKQQLENQGYLPEQAQQAAQQYMQTRQAQVDLMKKAEEYGQHLAGKTAAAEHFAQKYNLTMADLTTLRQAETPDVMEQLAKNISERRGVDDELAKLRQGQVPVQSFDNSQGTPDVAPNDNGWLDRYNTGDRSEQAITAARKAAGLS